MTVKTYSIPECVLNSKLHNAIEKVSECQIDNIVRKIADSRALGHTPENTPALFRNEILRTGCDIDREKHIMEDAGAEYLGKGSQRDVYKVDDCVIKLPNDIQNRRANIIEDAAWDMATPGIRQYFAPVIDADINGTYITMPYATLPKDKADAEHMIAEIYRGLIDQGFHVDDIHERNIATYKHRPVLIDYGMNVSSTGVR